MTRTEPCACGGLLTADDTDQDDVAAAVTYHLQTSQHAAWWAACERTEPERTIPWALDERIPLAFRTVAA